MVPFSTGGLTSLRSLFKDHGFLGNNLAQSLRQFDNLCFLGEVNLRYHPLIFPNCWPSTNLVPYSGKVRLHSRGVNPLADQPVESAHVFALGQCCLGQKAVAFLVKSLASHSHPVVVLDGVIPTQLGIATPFNRL